VQHVVPGGLDGLLAPLHDVGLACFAFVGDEVHRRGARAHHTSYSLEGCFRALAAPRGRRPHTSSQPRIDRLALQRQDAEHALVHAVERLVLDEAVQRLEGAEGTSTLLLPRLERRDDRSGRSTGSRGVARVRQPALQGGHQGAPRAVGRAPASRGSAIGTGDHAGHLLHRVRAAVVDAVVGAELRGLFGVRAVTAFAGGDRDAVVDRATPTAAPRRGAAPRAPTARGPPRALPRYGTALRPSLIPYTNQCCSPPA